MNFTTKHTAVFLKRTSARRRRTEKNEVGISLPCEFETQPSPTPRPTTKPQALTDIGSGRAGIAAPTEGLAYVPKVMQVVGRSSDGDASVGEAAGAAAGASSSAARVDESALEAEQL